jgi:DNA helicase II / ATP-dependent DNA helicase PcrA
MAFSHSLGPERIEAIRRELNPLEIDLDQQNNRSPGTEIAIFGNDILRGRARGRAYDGVSQMRYSPRSVDLSLMLRRCLAIGYRKCRAKGIRPENCAILAATGKDVASITSALSGGARPVSHRVVFDEAKALLASRFAAFMLEPKKSMRPDLCAALELLANMERASATKGGRENAQKFRCWADEIGHGKKISAKGLWGSLVALITGLSNVTYSGDPRADWLIVKDAFRSCSDARLAAVASQLDYLVAFGRGRFLAANLLELWVSTGSYSGATRAFDVALAQDAIL